MSTTYEIIRFAKPSKKELQMLDYFYEYDSFRVIDSDGDDTSEYIRLFRTDDKLFSNLVGSRFAQRIELPEIVTDYKTLYKDLGFDEEAIYNEKIYPIYSNGLHADYTDGVIEKRINFSELDNYKIKVTVSCVAIKMEPLWNSDEVCFCPNRERIKKYIPDLNEYRFAPINNGILAKAEIPFLIFERNKGKCFIEKH